MPPDSARVHRREGNRGPGALTYTHPAAAAILPPIDKRRMGQVPSKEALQRAGEAAAAAGTAASGKGACLCVSGGWLSLHCDDRTQACL